MTIPEFAAGRRAQFCDQGDMSAVTAKSLAIRTWPRETVPV